MMRSRHTDTRKEAVDSAVVTDSTGTEPDEKKIHSTVEHVGWCRRIIRTFVWPVILFIGGILFGCIYPRHVDTDAATIGELRVARDQMNLAELDHRPAPGPLLMPIMTFNIRMDAVESNPDNNFSNRLARIVRVFDDVQPWIAGLQEVLPDQLKSLEKALPKYYKPVWNHSATRNDTWLTMMYDERQLGLIEQDFLWLSDTPRIPKSKSPGATNPHTINIARFRVLSTTGYRSTEVLAFNTHLDVRSEEARRYESAIAAATIAEWKERYPRAVVVMFGDFNTSVGQASYVTLTNELQDTWKICQENSSSGDCRVNQFASSFHGWQGTLMNTYAGRMVMGAAFTLHAMGFNTPHHIPTTIRGWLAVVRDLFLRAPKFSLREALPSWPWNRLHVDWILFSPPTVPVSSTGEELLVYPKLVTLFDVRDSEFSSDHFPVVTLLVIQRKF